MVLGQDFVEVEDLSIPEVKQDLITALTADAEPYNVYRFPVGQSPGYDGFGVLMVDRFCSFQRSLRLCRASGYHFTAGECLRESESWFPRY